VVNRKKVIIEQKRQQVALQEEEFTAQVFSMTTDDDMPEYNQFDFA
jgi:hypothetical protein